MDSVEEKKEFVCNRCGACCKNIKYYEPASFLDRGDGVCKYYDEKDKACIIYDFRPNFCKVGNMYNMYKDKMTWNEYIDLSYESCKILMKMEKINEFKEIYPSKLRHYYENDDVEIEDSVNELLEDKVVVNTSKEEYLFDEDIFEGE